MAEQQQDMVTKQTSLLLPSPPPTRPRHHGHPPSALFSFSILHAYFSGTSRLHRINIGNPLLQVGGSTVDMSEESLNYDYVVENVLTKTDRFLEKKVSGEMKTWHLIFFISSGILVLSKYKLRYLHKSFYFICFSHDHVLLISYETAKDQI